MTVLGPPDDFPISRPDPEDDPEVVDADIYAEAAAASADHLPEDLHPLTD